MPFLGLNLAFFVRAGSTADLKFENSGQLVHVC